MMDTSQKKYFQDSMPGNVCFGCGNDNHEGLQIKSYWDGDEAVCIWNSQEKYHGWSDLMNGGIIATLIDCHCMGTAMAHAYKLEERPLDSMPEYRYATGTLNIRYQLPTSNIHPAELRARIKEVKGKKTVLDCQLISQGKVTVVAEVVAIRVFDSSQDGGDNIFKS